MQPRCQQAKQQRKDNEPAQPTSSGQRANRPKRAQQRKQRAGGKTRSVPPVNGTGTARDTSSTEAKTSAQGAWGPKPAMAAAHQQHQDCAIAAHRQRRDGKQRPMTPLEEETLRLWTNRKLQLSEPPRFLVQTHTSAERDVFWNFHVSSIGFRLSALLPVGFTLPAESTKYHFCHAVLLANQDPQDREQARALLAAPSYVDISPTSQIVEFTFLDASERDRWNGRSVKIGRAGAFTLRPSDVSARDAALEYSDAEVALLYEVHVLGRRADGAHAVRRWMQAATSVPIMTIESRDPVGEAAFAPHVWRVVFDSRECPAALTGKRLLVVDGNGISTNVYVHHPRAARRYPCKACLSVQHYRKECAAADPAKQATKHTLTLTMDTATAPPTIQPAVSVVALRWQMRKVRQALAPTLLEVTHPSRKTSQGKDARSVKDKAVAAAAQAAKTRMATHAVAPQRANHVVDDLNSLRAPASASKPERLSTATQAAPTIPQQPPMHTPTPHAAENELMGKEDAPAPATLPQPDSNRNSDQKSRGNDCAPPEPMDVCSEPAPPTRSTVTELFPEPTSPSETGTPRQGATTLTLYTPPQADWCWDPAEDPGTPNDKMPAQVAPVQPRRGSRLASINEAKDSEPDDVVPMVTDAENAKPNCAFTTADGADSPKRERSESMALLNEDNTFTQRARSNTQHNEVHGTAATATDTKTKVSEVGGLPGHPSSMTERSVKRERTDSMHVSATREAEQIPARLQRANTGHRDVHQEPQRAGLAVQTSMEKFLSGTKTQASASVDPDSTLPSDQSNAPQPSFASFDADDQEPKTLAEWLEAVRGKLYDVPSNGSCLYYALHGVKAPGFKADSVTLSKTNAREANYYRARIAETYAATLDSWSAERQLEIDQLVRRYELTTSDIQPREAAVKKHILAAGRKDCSKACTRRWWAGPEELMAAAIFLREPIFVLDVTPSHNTFMQAYVPDFLRLEVPDSIAIVRTRLLDPLRAYQTLRTLLSNRVIPLVLVLTHRDTGGHFQAVRFRDVYYADWNNEDANGETMRDRLEATLVSMNYPVLSSNLPPLDRPVVTTNLDLHYEPSDSASTQDSLAAGPNATSQLESMSQLSTFTDDGAPTRSASNSDFDSEATVAAHAGLPNPSAAAHLDHDELLLDVPDGGRRRTGKAGKWSAVCARNDVALSEWKQRQSTSTMTDLGIPPVGVSHKTVKERVATSVAAWISLARTLPYPVHFMALQSQSVLISLGKELICLGRVCALERIEMYRKDEGSREFLATWRTGISCSTENQWQLCSSTIHRNRAAMLAPHLALSIQDSTFSMDDEATLMTILTTFGPGSAAELSERSLGDQARATAEQLRTRPHVSMGQTILDGIRRGDWSAVAAERHPTSAQPEGLSVGGSCRY